MGSCARRVYAETLAHLVCVLLGPSRGGNPWLLHVGSTFEAVQATQCAAVPWWCTVEYSCTDWAYRMTVPLAARCGGLHERAVISEPSCVRRMDNCIFLGRPPLSLPQGLLAAGPHTSWTATGEQRRSAVQYFLLSAGTSSVERGDNDKRTPIQYAARCAAEETQRARAGNSLMPMGPPRAFLHAAVGVRCRPFSSTCIVRGTPVHSGGPSLRSSLFGRSSFPDIHTDKGKAELDIRAR